MKRRKSTKQRPQVGLLGKELTRRSRGRCELCLGRDDVRGFELAPWPEKPDAERALMACHRCRSWLQDGAIEPIEAHFLSTAVYSTTTPVRLAAARLLLDVDSPENPWLATALHAANIDPDTGEFRDSA
ncbi:MAG: hypothetical protein EP330_23110 [Deltaproteobacteria bacterium]|nr:MAG: hypothetical protein EP330_23110 [Deltaproteobacteria bacterium]